MKKDKFYVTTPIYYANAPPHLGGAYTTIAADVLARWQKLQGKEVFFLTGTDEHGQKIQEAAERDGLSPKEFVDKIAEQWKKTFKLLNVSNDFFIRTTNPKHEEEVKKVLQELYDKGYIYKGFYESNYCIGCEQYLNESDIVDGKCPLHDRKVELQKEEAYLFKLSNFQKEISKSIKTGEFLILPEKAKNEALNFIDSGLNDISISRLKENVDWGIELPFDKDHTCFVWVDAFWNYISGLKINKAFSEFWPADVQLMAKDILRVHATIWPALLLATKNKLPKQLFVHGYFTVGGRKMSKSLGNVIDPVELIEKYGVDAVRYYLMRNIPFGQDGDVSEKGLIDRYNNELADKFGNLVSRVTSLAEKNGLEKLDKGEEGLLLCPSQVLDKSIDIVMKDFQFDRALNIIFEEIGRCNEYIQMKKPWETKDKKVLYELVNMIKSITILLWPFIPGSCEKIAKQFGFEISLDTLRKPINNLNIKKGEVLFRKITTEN